MTIKELEERTSMTRANIRFYESEGLLAPERLPNGYRDYSEEDARTLEKIKLLRELHLDIDTIRLVQKGELTLEQALFSTLTKLEGDKAALGRAVEICRELEQSGVEYAALEPKPWLTKLETPRYPRIVEPPKPVSRPLEIWTDYAHDHPWRRWLARLVDGWLFSLPVDAVYILALGRNPGRAGGLEDWFVGLVGIVLMLLCEPFFLHYWGWTPGKWIFGLKVRGGRGGRNLTLGEGFWRAGGVFFSGYGLSIPIVNLVCLWKRWKESRAGDPAPWDEDTEYTCESRRLDWLMFLGAMAALFGMLVLLVLWAYLPPNRGELTEREYYENINHCMEWMTESEYRLTETGQWYVKSENPRVWVFHDCPDIRVATGKEGIRSVTLTSKGMGWGEYIQQDVGIYQIALVALMAQEKISTTEYNEWTALFEEQWDDFETEYKGVRIVQTVDASGYVGIGQILAPGEDAEQSYLKTVTITLTGSE